MKLGEIIEVICGLFFVVFIAIPVAFMLAIYFYIEGKLHPEKYDDNIEENEKKPYVCYGLWLDDKWCKSCPKNKGCKEDYHLKMGNRK